jgi:RNA polymerase sigma factor (sigma-70 family)
LSAADVKVIPFRSPSNAAHRPREAEDLSEPELPPGLSEDAGELENAQSVGAVRKVVRRKIRRVAAPSPAMVIARALGGFAQPRPAPLPQQPAGSDSRRKERDDGSVWPVWLEHRSYLRAHALRFSSGNVADAEDALSEAMVKAAQTFQAATIRNQRAWLLRLVHNACMDRHRSNRRQSRLAKDITDADVQSAPAVAIQPDRSPEELLAALEQMTDLQRGLDELPDFLSRPLLLYLDDLSDAEIAGSLNVTREVVRKRRQIARQLLRRHMSM